MALTDSWLKANAGKDRDRILEKADRDGMTACVSPKGKVTFHLRFRIDGKQQRMAIGTYPGTSLKDAREKSIKYKEMLREGHDPRIARQVEKINNANVVTVSDLFEQWYADYCAVHKALHSQIRKSFELHLLPSFGNLPVDKISTNDWMKLFSDVKQRSPSIAERLLGNSKQMLAWAARREVIERNVLERMTGKRDLGLVKKPVMRSLDDQEIRMLLLALGNNRMALKNKLFIRLCLIYGCRNGELRTCEAKDLDFEKGIWTVPAAKHKMGAKTGKPLVRPITEGTRLLFKECLDLAHGSQYLFNNAGTKEMMGDKAPLSMPYHLRQWLKTNHKYEMEHWSVHDLRKTARTNFSKLTQPHIAEVMLGHKLPGEWSTYDHHHYLDEQAECLTRWIERLNQLSNENLSES